MTSDQTFDCSTLIYGTQGEAYCHEYENYLNFFRMLAHSSTLISCKNVPSCWGPFILYLGHKIDSDANYVDSIGSAWESSKFPWIRCYLEAKDKRRVIEIASSCRPELVHALYCADTEWPCPLKEKHEHEKSFVVTCNASFFRPEVQEYRKQLRGHVPEYKKAVLVPCAAAKPYPAPIHCAVLNTLDNLFPGNEGDDWHVITATGVLGLVPQELWRIMPHYDSGLPNLSRCADTVRWYFRRHKYTHLVIYSDFYAPAIYTGLQDAGWDGYAKFVFGTHFRDHYENLLLEESLQMLEEALLLVHRQEGPTFSSPAFEEE